MKERSSRGLPAPRLLGCPAMSSRGLAGSSVRRGALALGVAFSALSFGASRPAPTLEKPKGSSWVARCNELEFRFDSLRKQAQVSMVTPKGLFPLAVGRVHFDNGLAMRATLTGLGEGPSMDVGLNRDRKIVYVFRKNAETGAKDDAVFCATEIRVE